MNQRSLARHIRALAVAEDVEILEFLFLTRGAGKVGEAMRVVEIELDVAEDGENGKILFDDESLGVFEKLEALVAIDLDVGRGHEGVELWRGVLPIVVAVAGAVDVEKGGRVAVVAVPRAASDH